MSGEPSIPKRSKIQRRVNGSNPDHISERSVDQEGVSPLGSKDVDGPPNSESQGPFAEVTRILRFQRHRGTGKYIGVVKITNLRDQNGLIMFKLRTNYPDSFTIKPPLGFIKSGLTSKITISLLQDQPHDLIPIHRLQVKVLRIPRNNICPDEDDEACDPEVQETSSRDITSTRTILENIWQQFSADGELVERHRVTCTLPGSPPGVVPVPPPLPEEPELPSMIDPQVPSDNGPSKRMRSIINDNETNGDEGQGQGLLSRYQVWIVATLAFGLGVLSFWISEPLKIAIDVVL